MIDYDHFQRRNPFDYRKVGVYVRPLKMGYYEAS